MGSLRDFFAGRAVLITGAAGSIGGAISHAIAELGCARLGLLDHFDHALMEISEDLRRAFPETAVTDILCDVRTPTRMNASFARFRPDLVIHAAALKHVHMGERHPAECVLTNLGGVRTSVEAAYAAGAELFVLISSDKAAAPVCTMGACKRLAELYLEGHRREQQRRPHARRMQSKVVRFGNVYGTQGSVVPKFLAQIERGGPVELTHPGMERYFMSLPQAVRLILEVAALDEADDECVGARMLDMGDPVKIMDLARELIQAKGSSAEIVITGLREGEKLHEELCDESEDVSETVLAGVHRVTPRWPDAAVSTQDVLALEDLAHRVDDQVLRQRVFALLDARLGRREVMAG